MDEIISNTKVDFDVLVIYPVFGIRHLKMAIIIHKM
jgi:hypothetical protein